MIHTRSIYVTESGSMFITKNNCFFNINELEKRFDVKSEYVIISFPSKDKLNEALEEGRLADYVEVLNGAFKPRFFN